MEQADIDILTKILENSDSVLIVFFVLLIIFLILIFIPIYKLSLQDKESRLKNENEKMENSFKRDALLIDVITKNTEVISDLKSLFENILDPSLNHLEEQTNIVIEKIDDLASEIRKGK